MLSFPDEGLPGISGRCSNYSKFE